MKLRKAILLNLRCCVIACLVLLLLREVSVFREEKPADGTSTNSSSSLDEHHDLCLSSNTLRRDQTRCVLLQCWACTWQWADDPPTPLLRWEKMYSLRFAAEFAVNSMGNSSGQRKSEAQRLFTRNLTTVNMDKVKAGQGPFPVLTTTSNYADFRQSAQTIHDVVLVSSFSTYREVKGAPHDFFRQNILSVAVDVATLAAVDVGNKCTGFGWGTWHCPDVDGEMPRMYMRIVSALTSPGLKQGRQMVRKQRKKIVSNDIFPLPLTSPSERGYLNGLDWFPPTPGHMMDDLVQILAAHHTSRKHPVILLSSGLRHNSILQSFLLFFRKFYPFDVFWAERHVMYRGNVTYAPLQDTGHTPSAVNFMSTQVIPRLMSEHRRLGTAVIRKPIMVKLAGGPGSPGQAIRSGRKFAALVAAEGWTFVLAGSAPLEKRAYWLNTAETVLLSWGGTMTVMMYMYGQRHNPLHIVLLVPFRTHYWEEAVVLGLAGNGHGDVRSWYVEGWELHHFSFPNCRIKLVFLPSGDADDLDADDLHFHRDVFDLGGATDRQHFATWSNDTVQHELLSRRMLGANRVLQAKVQERRESRLWALALLHQFCASENRSTFCTVPLSYSTALQAGAAGGSLYSSEAPFSSAALLFVDETVTACLSNTSNVALAMRAGSGLIRESSPCLGILADSGEVRGAACEGLEVCASNLNQAARMAPLPLRTRAGRAVWALGGASQADLGAVMHDFFAALGLLVLHRLSLAGMVVLVSDLNRGLSESALRLYRANVVAIANSLGASIEFMPAGSCRTELPYRQVIFGSPLPTWWHITSARQFALAGFLHATANVAGTSLRRSRRVACFLSSASSIDAVNAARHRLERLNYTVLVDANSSEALEVINTAESVLVPYGDTFLYYATHWGRADRVQRFVIVCELPEHQARCRPGNVNAKDAFFYSLGDNFALRNGEVKYVRAPSIGWTEVLDSDLVFDGIPAPSALGDSLWLHPQQDEEVERLRRWAAASVVL